MHSIASGMTIGALDHLPSSQSITAEIAEAMPVKGGPTSLGAASLTPAPAQQLNEEELGKFLQQHELEFCKDMDGISWRAHKVKYVLERNEKLINPSLSKDKQRMLKHMLLEVACCLATKIEDLH